MLLVLTILLAALATSDVSAQASHNYDLPNCNAPGLVKVGNHVANRNDCRSYFNCDNADGGKKVDCADGTLYYEVRGICGQNVLCPKWSNDTNNINSCNMNPQFSRKYVSVCCQTYFTYYCNDTITTSTCPTNTYFSENAQRCINTIDSNCANCTGRNPDPCAIHMAIPGKPCYFTYKDRPEFEMKCPWETRWDAALCQCVHDSATCPVPPEISLPQGCGDKRGWDGRVFIHLTNPDPLPTPPSPPYNALWRLKGADILHAPFALMLQFTDPQPTANARVNILNSVVCTGIRLSVQAYGNFNGQTRVEVQLSYGVSGNTDLNTVTLSGTRNAGGEIKLLIVTGASPLLQAYLDSNNNGLTVSNGNIGFLTTLKNTDGTSCQLCELSVNGNVRSPKIAFWRSCTDTNRMMNFLN